jgi:gas vesicle protein
MSNRDASSFLTGLLVGAVLGVAIGFLYAPQSGKETRELLKEKAEVAKQKAVEVSKKVRQTAEEAIKKVQAASE